MGITHTFVSAIADDPTAAAAGEVLPSHWNADHDISLTSSDVGLGNVTNDVQTKAAILPNTGMDPGKVPIGNAGGTAYVPRAISGDGGLAEDGTLTVIKTNGASFAASATTDTTDASNISAGTLDSARLDAQLQSLAGLSYTGNTLKVVRVNAGETAFELATPAATGDVVGPASSTDNAIARFDSTTGKLVQNSSATVADTGQVLSGFTSTNAATYSFTGDSTTGWGYRSAGVLTAMCNNSESLRMTSSYVWVVGSTGYMLPGFNVGLSDSGTTAAQIHSGTPGTFRDLKLRNVLAGGGNGSYIQTPSMTVANLAAAGTAGAGARAFVTDANTTHVLGLGTTVVGGGANKVPVYSDGTNWLIG